MHGLLRFLVLGIITLPLAAQTATPPVPSAPAAGERPVVELSPFEVRADNDVGYQAANTTSGSRLNSRLRDTPIDEMAAAGRAGNARLALQQLARLVPEFAHAPEGTAAAGPR